MRKPSEREPGSAARPNLTYIKLPGRLPPEAMERAADKLILVAEARREKYSQHEHDRKCDQADKRHPLLHAAVLADADDGTITARSASPDKNLAPRNILGIDNPDFDTPSPRACAGQGGG